jgi:hypothetical protein
MDFLSDGWKATLADIGGCDVVEHHFNGGLILREVRKVLIVGDLERITPGFRFFLYVANRRALSSMPLYLRQRQIRQIHQRASTHCRSLTCASEKQPFSDLGNSYNHFRRLPRAVRQH